MSFMSDRWFLDTNVLVYAYDTANPSKQARARALLRESIRTGDGHVSPQVLGEFFVIVTRKIAEPMSVEQATEALRSFSALPVGEIDRQLVNRAVDTVQRYRISYWDALIIAGAERAGCTRIYSEDLNDGQQYHEIQVQNPFAE